MGTTTRPGTPAVEKEIKETVTKKNTLELADTEKKDTLELAATPVATEKDTAPITEELTPNSLSPNFLMNFINGITPTQKKGAAAILLAVGIAAATIATCGLFGVIAGLSALGVNLLFTASAVSFGLSALTFWKSSSVKFNSDEIVRRSPQNHHEESDTNSKTVDEENNTTSVPSLAA